MVHATSSEFTSTRGFAGNSEVASGKAAVGSSHEEAFQSAEKTVDDSAMPQPDIWLVFDRTGEDITGKPASKERIVLCKNRFLVFRTRTTTS